MNWKMLLFFACFIGVLTVPLVCVLSPEPLAAVEWPDSVFPEVWHDSTVYPDVTPNIPPRPPATRPGEVIVQWSDSDSIGP